MAATDPLGKAVLAVPALGIAVGAAGAFKWLSQRKADGKGKEKDNG
jgi:hypothetical protein